MVDLPSLLAPDVHLIPFLLDKVAAAGDGTPVLYSLPLPLAMLLKSTAFPPLPSSFMFVDFCVFCRTCRGATTSQYLRPLELQGLFYKCPKFTYLST